MNIDRKEFLGVIQRVAPMTKTRTTLPALSMVRLEAADGIFCATATDLNCFVKASCDCQGDLEPICVAPGPLQAIAGYGPASIAITLEETRLKVVSGSQARLSTLSAGEFSLWPNDKLTDLGVNPSDLATAMESVAWAADPRSVEHITRQAIGVKLVTKDNKLVVFAADGKQFAYHSKAAVVPNAEFVLLASMAGPLCEAMRGTEASVQLSDNWISVKSKHFDCAVKLVDQRFPNIEPILDEEAEFVCSLPKEPAIEALAAMKACSDDAGFVKAIGSTCETGFRFEFAGKTNDFRAVVECVQPNKPTAHVRFDAIRLHDLLKNIDGETLKFSVNDLQLRFESGDVLAILAQIRGQCFATLPEQGSGN